MTFISLLLLLFHLTFPQSFHFGKVLGVMTKRNFENGLTNMKINSPVVGEDKIVTTLQTQNLAFSFESMSTMVLDEHFTPYYSDREEESFYMHDQEAKLRLIVVSGLDLIEKEEYERSQFLLFESMYDQKLPPYPEFLTNATGCPEEFLPKRHETTIGTYYTVYADDRFNQGICADEVARYKAGVGIFYCQEMKQAVKVVYMIDKSQDFSTIDTFMNSFICKIP